MRKWTPKAKTPFRIYRLGFGSKDAEALRTDEIGWVAEHISRPLRSYHPHAVWVFHPKDKDWSGQPIAVKMMRGRTPFEALEHLKQAVILP